jgi:uncharacterized DUF497 family protein
MSSLSFTWDEAKAASNLADHKVSFEQAKGVFSDPFGIEFEDDRERYGEQRFLLIGMSEGRLLTVVYTNRDEAIRLISARQSEPYERRMYHEEND